MNQLVPDFSTIESDYDFEAAANRYDPSELNNAYPDGGMSLRVKNEKKDRSKNGTISAHKNKIRLTKPTFNDPAGKIKQMKNRLSKRYSDNYDIPNLAYDVSSKGAPPSPPSNSPRSLLVCKCVVIAIFLFGLISAAGFVAYYMYGLEIMCFLRVSKCKGNLKQ